MLQSLTDMEIASKLMKEGKETPTEHPIDSHYLSLKTEISPVAKEDADFQLLTKYIKTTHGHTHTDYTLELLECFKVARETEDASFEPWNKNENRVMLWHGSRLTNYMGILSQGLRIAPPEAPSTGYMFGKGVYFADSCSKSANYCATSKHNTTGIVILCEVALGDMYLKRQAEPIKKLKSGFLSTKGEGRYQPKASTAVTMSDGCVVPCGPLTDTGITDSALIYNEYVVYDIAQVRMRYLLKLKFHYK